MQNVSIASFGRGPPFYPESFIVSLNRWAAMIVKFFMCVQKKLHRPTKDLIVLTSVGGFASLMALSLFFPRFDAFRGECETQIGHFFISEKTFVQVDLEVVCLTALQNLFQNLKVVLMSLCMHLEIVNVDNDVAYVS
jgi:hypothetical protein